MEWRDQGVLLALRRHGESAAILDVFTAEHGRHAGVVPGGGGVKMAGILQPGAQLDLTWRARLEGHIGSYRVELLRGRAGAVLGDRLALAGLNALCALLVFALPEREAHPRLYRASLAVFDALAGDAADWPLAYLRWELTLLEDLGYGLDLSRCAVTGGAEDLAYVSPRSGRAVSRTGAGEWVDRLLPLPACLLGQAPAGPGDLLAGLRTTGYFLHNHMAAAFGERPLPAARERLVALLAGALPAAEVGAGPGAD